MKDLFGWTNQSKKFDRGRRQPRNQCLQAETEEENRSSGGGDSSPKMASSSCKISPIIPIFVCFLLVSYLVCPVHSSEHGDRRPSNQSVTQRMRRIREHLKKINKPAVKTIQVLPKKILRFVVYYIFSTVFLFGYGKSCTKIIILNEKEISLKYEQLSNEISNIITSIFPEFNLIFFLIICVFYMLLKSLDGDLIDCVLADQQPAFDHPQLRGLKPLDLPEKPRGRELDGIEEASFQLWHLSGDSCPEGTIPTRRTSEEDMYRASSIRRFGRKTRRYVRRDSTGGDHEHAVGYVSGDQFYGAKASINVWAPRVANPYEFSISQMWVISGSFGDDLNTIEAGWQVSPELYGDSYPRFFTYWTTDAYQTTGCYNLLCSGFVQTNNKIAIGAAISPTSSYNGGQFDISLLIWKDPKHGNWWLEFGSGILVGYWPSILFTRLRDHASMVQFGGEIVNSRSNSFHTSTQMGSGHFAGEGFGRASYFRNLQVVDWDNSLIPLSNLRVLADHPNCYDIQGGINNVWGNYFYYGGPGRNVRCP